MESSGLHSAEHFGEQRDFWWNRDFVQLMGQRCGLQRARQVLDVGAGVGHWTRVLLPVLSPDAEVRGVDAEQEWVAQANAWAERAGLAERVKYERALAEQLPFADASFDLVTCQTLLIHVRDPRRVLREFLRVLRPGGQLLLAEPNNLTNALVRDSVSAAQPIEELVQLVKLQALCERGKAALGEGDNSVGDLLPGMLAELGARELHVWQSDRCSALVPPYATPAEQALKQQLIDWADREVWIWDRAGTLRYFLAGGGAEQDFEGLWSVALRRVRAVRDGLKAGTYATGGAEITYVLSATK